MGILANIFRQKILQQQPDGIQQEPYQDDMMPMGAAGVSGQPLPPIMQPTLPPTLEKETMDLYLKVKTPEEPEKLEGIKRYWVFTDNESATEVPTSNLDSVGQKEILNDLQIASDFDGCDNCNRLRQDKMLMIHAKILTDKARSDYSDRLRERIVPAVGISMFGQHNPGGQQVERPKENRSVFGAFGGGGRQY